MSGVHAVSHLGKSYRRYEQRWHRVCEWVSAGRVAWHQDFWALRSVTFLVASGESVGGIGLNGAGKTTLLKILTGTTQPTEGHVEISGRVASLLELGIGFHPDFSGRQNAVTFEARIVEVDLLAADGRPARAFTVGERGRVRAGVEFSARVVAPTIGILIRDRVGHDVFGTNSFYVASIEDAYEPGDDMTVEFDVDLNLGAGTYTLTIAVHSDATHLANNCDGWDKVIGFQIVPGSESSFIGSAWLPVRLRVERRGRTVTSARPGAGERA